MLLRVLWLYRRHDGWAMEMVLSRWNGMEARVGKCGGNGDWCGRSSWRIHECAAEMVDGVRGVRYRKAKGAPQRLHKQSRE